MTDEQTTAPAEETTAPVGPTGPLSGGNYYDYGRHNALSLALQFTAQHPDLGRAPSPRKVVAVADIFYQFMNK